MEFKAGVPWGRKILLSHVMSILLAFKDCEDLQDSQALLAERCQAHSLIRPKAQFVELESGALAVA